MEGNRDRRVGQETDGQFFALLRSGLWNEVPERASFASGTDWEALYRLAYAQTVVPLVTDGINRLPRELLPAEPDRLDPFLGSLMSTALRNRKLDAFLPKLFGALDGIPAVLCRSSLTDKKRPAGYNIVTLWPDRISFTERRPGHKPEEPWYECALAPVRDTVTYDADGIAASYPWMRYDVNARYPQVQEVWKFKDHSNVAAGFARRGSRAWYTTASGSVRCIRIGDGKLLWSKDFPGKIFSTPAVCGRYLVFGCTDGSIYALNARNGRTIWTAKAGKSVLASPVILKGRVFIGASDGVFRALDLRSGRELWRFEGVDGFVECRPFADDRQVVFGSWANKLYSLDPQTGALQWMWRCKKSSRMYSPAATWPVKAAGRIFIAVPDRKVYALDAATGEELFRVDGGREAIGLSSDGTTVLAKTMHNTSYAFRADVPRPAAEELPNESLLWRVPNGAHYEIGPTQLLELCGLVLTPTDKGNLIALSLADGTPQWYHKISTALINPLQAWKKGRSLYILASAMDGTVTLLRVAI